MKTKNKYMGWWQKPITMVRGSTYIITAVPLQNQSDGHWIGGPLQLKALIRLYAQVLARKVAHLSQGTLRTAISALITYPGHWLARFQHWWRNYLKTSWQLPLYSAVPTPVASLPYGVQKRQNKVRRFALFRHGAVHHTSSRGAIRSPESPSRSGLPAKQIETN